MTLPRYKHDVRPIPRPRGVRLRSSTRPPSLQPRGSSPLSTPSSHRQDVSLLRAAANGEAQARHEFGMRLACVPAILRAINRQRGLPLQPDELDDVVQEVAAAVWRKTDSYRGVGSLESWLYQFAIFEFLRYLDRRRRRLRRVQVLDEIEACGEGDEAPASIRFDHVHRGLAQLDASERDVVRAKCFEQLTFDEIAAKMSMSPNTVKTRYYRGIHRMATLLRADEEEQS